MKNKSNDQTRLVESTQAPSEMEKAFLFIHGRYPIHRKLDAADAEKAWCAAKLSDEEIRGLIKWLTERQAEDPAWHSLAYGMYVPKIDAFLKQRWWLTPKAIRKEP